MQRWVLGLLSITVVLYILRSCLTVRTRYGPYEVYRELAYSIPESCRVLKVSSLYRHASRFPTKAALYRMQTAIQKLKKDCSHSRLAFLKDYDLDLSHDDLLPVGYQEAKQSGFQIASRYSHLSNKPVFTRASGANRVVESAKSFMKGLEIADHPASPLLVIPDSKGSNNTLSNHQCPNSDYFIADRAVEQYFAAEMHVVTDRVNRLAPNAHLSNQDIISLMSLCPLESAAHQNTSLICSLFDDGEWSMFESAWDLEKYYFTGYGNPLGPVQGAGWITELISRFTGQLVRDATQTNRTLHSPDLFPLHDVSVYADFSHDNEIIAIISALGLVREPLDPTSLDPHRRWRVSKMVPFSGRLTAELLECAEGQQVRLLLNDMVQLLPSPCPPHPDHLCPLDTFIASQKFALESAQILWPACGHVAND